MIFLNDRKNDNPETSDTFKKKFFFFIKIKEYIFKKCHSQKNYQE